MEQKLTQNKTASAFLKKAFQRYFIDAMGAMALGLFSSLIIGLILSQLSKFSFLGFLEPYAAMVSASSPVVGAAIGVAIAQGLKSKPLVLFSCAVSGAYGYAVGGPVGAYIGAVFGAEIGGLVAGKTKVDIIVSPITTIVSGCAVAQLVGAGIQAMMNGLGAVINSATQLTPFPMGILVLVIVGMVLTAPISSAALCIMLDLNGLAAGAAVVGCCCQMVGFAVISYRDNGLGGLLSQGLGTSMLQVPNIVRRPLIWIPPILSSAVLGPIAISPWFNMVNNATGSGMGSAGLVGQIMTYQTMTAFESPVLVLIKIVVFHFLLPAVITMGVARGMRKMGYIHNGDMKLEV